MKEIFRKHLNVLATIFFALGVVGAWQTYTVTTVNDKQADDLKTYIAAHRAFHCINGHMEFWQIDETTHEFKKYRLGKNPVDTTNCYLAPDQDDNTPVEK